MNKYEIKSTNEFTDWLSSRDMQLRTKVLAKINQIQSGNFGDHKSLGDQVSELRLMYGPGYRIYYTIRNRIVVILLCAGDKSSQKRNIKKAKELAKEV